MFKYYVMKTKSIVLDNSTVLDVEEGSVVRGENGVITIDGFNIDVDSMGELIEELYTIKDKYALYGGERYESSGGLGDCLGYFNNVEEAKKAGEAILMDDDTYWIEIVDRTKDLHSALLYRGYKEDDEVDWVEVIRVSSGSYKYGDLKYELKHVHILNQDEKDYEDDEIVEVEEVRDNNLPLVCFINIKRSNKSTSEDVELLLDDDYNHGPRYVFSN